KPARGRFREFMQCDVDIVGVKEMSADAEVISVGISALRSVLAKHEPGFTVRLSNRKILNALCEKIGVGDDRAVALFRTLDKLDKAGREQVQALLKSEVSLDDKQIADVFAYLDCPVTPTDFAKLETFLQGTRSGEEGVAEMKAVVKHVAEQGYLSYL